MYPHNHGTGNHTYATPQAYVPMPIPTNATPTSVPSSLPAPVYPTPLALPVPVQQHRSRSNSRTPTPTAPILNPVPVPPGHHPIELVQFYRADPTRNPPWFLHWALFVRTAPRPAAVSGTGPTHRLMTDGRGAARGNVYELVGTAETYTAQFLANVAFEPEMLADWRGTHVIGWVSPGQLHVFERVARQVRVLRYQPDWRCHQWVYDVVCAVRGGSYQGMFIEGVTFGTLQKHMGRLLEAWENGDI